MGHGAIRVGGFELISLCDGVAESSGELDESFPGVSPADWDRYRAAFPDAFTERDRWRFHIHAFVVRSPDLTVLVDTGVGPPNAPGREWAPACGRLAEDLRDLAIDPDSIDVVVLTHFHDDHIGWAVGEDGSLVFPNARHLMARADWDLLEQDEDPEAIPYRDRLLGPLRDAAVLDFVEDGHQIAPGLTIEHAPGHTPGHVSLRVESDGERALIAGDVLNHPGQIADRFPSGSDHDPSSAADTRERILSAVERKDIILSTAHLTEPFGRIQFDDTGRRIWVPDS